MSQYHEYVISFIYLKECHEYSRPVKPLAFTQNAMDTHDQSHLYCLHKTLWTLRTNPTSSCLHRTLWTHRTNNTSTVYTERHEHRTNHTSRCLHRTLWTLRTSHTSSCLVRTLWTLRTSLAVYTDQHRHSGPTKPSTYYQHI